MEKSETTQKDGSREVSDVPKQMEIDGATKQVDEVSNDAPKQMENDGDTKQVGEVSNDESMQNENDNAVKSADEVGNDESEQKENDNAVKSADEVGNGELAFCHLFSLNGKMMIGIHVEVIINGARTPGSRPRCPDAAQSPFYYCS
uniref:Uncharacterized protein n=1 Tax=Lygus hesperus TaxID=30085 RepID=A0A146LWW1_LYGHE